MQVYAAIYPRDRDIFSFGDGRGRKMPRLRGYIVSEDEKMSWFRGMLLHIPRQSTVYIIYIPFRGFSGIYVKISHIYIYLSRNCGLYIVIYIPQMRDIYNSIPPISGLCTF